MIEILPINSTETVKEGLQRINDSINYYIYQNGKGTYKVRNIVFFDDKTREIYGRCRWFTSKNTTNNITNGVKIEDLKIKRNMADGIKAGKPFVYSLKEVDWDGMKNCDVYIPMSQMKGEIKCKKETYFLKEFALCCYEEGQVYIEFSRKLIKDGYNPDNEIDKVIEELHNLKNSKKVKNRENLKEEMLSILYSLR